MDGSYEKARLNVRDNIDYFLSSDGIDISLPDGNFLEGGQVLYITNYETEDVLCYEVAESPFIDYDDQNVIKYDDINALTAATIDLNIFIKWTFSPSVQASIFDDDLYTREYLNEQGINSVNFLGKNHSFLGVRRSNEDFAMPLDKSKKVDAIIISFDLFKFIVGG